MNIADLFIIQHQYQIGFYLQQFFFSLATIPCTVQKQKALRLIAIPKCLD